MTSDRTAGRTAGRALGVDLGDVRIGIAVSDPDGIVATPRETVAAPDDPDDIDALAALVGELAEREGAATVVIGWPRTLDAREGRPARRARLLAERLRKGGRVRVELFDERFSTVEAERVMLAQDASRRERRAAVDRVAATLILQAFLDAQRGGRAPGGERR